MSSIHSSVHWSSAQQTLHSTQQLIIVKTKMLDMPSYAALFTTYSPKDKSPKRTFGLLGNFCDHFGVWIKQSLKKQWPLLEKGVPIGWRTEDIERVFFDIIDAMRKKTLLWAYTHPKDDKIPLNILMTSENISKLDSTPDEMFESLNLLELTYRTYIKASQQEINPWLIRCTNLDSDIKDVSISIFLKGYELLGLQRDWEKVSFTEEDFEAFHVSVKEPTVDAKRLSGIAFAFLKLRESNAKDLIFFGDESKIYCNVLVECLFQWGYRPVTRANEGDLLIYFNGSNPCHAGIFCADGMVYSKLGKLNPYGMKHSIFNTPPNFGDSMIIFRKSTSKLF